MKRVLDLAACAACVFELGAMKIESPANSLFFFFLLFPAK